MPQPARPPVRAFSLIELLVVVSLLALVMGITFPVLRMIREDVQAKTGVNAVGVAVTAARAYANRDSPDLLDLVGVGADAHYSGTAIVFTPAHQIRLVENTQVAQDQDGNPLEGQQSQDEAANPTLSRRNGFRDLRREPIMMPSTTGVVGVARTRDGAGNSMLVLLAPPFAVRFNERGQLLPGDLGPEIPGAPNPAINRAEWVYYDGNFNGEYETNSVRPLNYDPTPWDPSRENFDPANRQFDPVTGEYRYLMPFEALEPVVGVIVYNKLHFITAGELQGFGPLGTYAIPDSGVSGTTPAELAARWILENGQPFFLNRYTGAVIRDR